MHKLGWSYHEVAMFDSDVNINIEAAIGSAIGCSRIEAVRIEAAAVDAGRMPW